MHGKPQTFDGRIYQPYTTNQKRALTGSGIRLISDTETQPQAIGQLLPLSQTCLPILITVK